MEVGQVSKSMGVDTKPAHRFEVAGHWVLIDPKMPIEIIDKLKTAIIVHDIEVIHYERRKSS